MNILLAGIGFVVILGVAMIAAAIASTRLQRMRDNERAADNGERCLVHVGKADKYCWDCQTLGPSSGNGGTR